MSEGYNANAPRGVAVLSLFESLSPRIASTAVRPSVRSFSCHRHQTKQIRGYMYIHVSSNHLNVETATAVIRKMFNAARGTH